MSQLDTSAILQVLKVKYQSKEVKDLGYPESSTYALLPKTTDLGGEYKTFAVQSGRPQGRSATFAVGQTYMTASIYDKFRVTPVKDYAFGQVDGMAMMQSRGKENSLVDGLEREMSSTIKTATRSIGVSLWRNGGGSRGQISATSNVATNTITLSNPEDAVNFERGMTLWGASTDGSSGSQLAGAVVLTAVNVDTGELTASSAWNSASEGIPGLAVNYYLFQAGDFGLMMAGIPAWIPYTTPSSSLFFNVNRAVDPVRLAGTRHTAGVGMPIEETLIELDSKIVSRSGMGADVVMIHPTDQASLVKSMGQRVMYDTQPSFDRPQIGFRSVVVAGMKGPIKVVPDMQVPVGYAWMLKLDTWEFTSIGEAPAVLDEDGGRMLRHPTADAYQFRVGGYFNLGCYSPVNNGVAKLY